MLTMLLKASVERCVRKGIDADYVVNAPGVMVERLVKAGLLPRSAYVERVPDPADRITRAALFGVMPLDLFKRTEDIQDFVDNNESKFELKEGEQVMRHLSIMIGRAGAYMPDLYATDAAAQLMFIAVGNEHVFRALMHGNTSPFCVMLNAIKGVK